MALLSKVSGDEMSKKQRIAELERRVAALEADVRRLHAMPAETPSPWTTYPLPYQPIYVGDVMPLEVGFREYRLLQGSEV